MPCALRSVPSPPLVVVGAALLALALGCNGKKNVGDAAAPQSASASTPSASAVAGYTAPSEGDGHLLLSAERLAAAKRRAAAGDAAWKALEENVDAYMGQPASDRTGPENIATVYLVTGEPRYCKAGLAFALERMKIDVRRGSYLYYGDRMREVAMVLDACRETFAPAERKAMADYLDRWTHELWFDNQGSGWALDDPGNNYFMAFLEGTAFAGYTLAGEDHPKADEYLALLRDKLENRVFPYLETRAKGGDFHEGVNYGQRSKQRLFDAFAVIASMGGPNHFDRPFVRDAVRYAFYQLQPDRISIYPGGDLARDAAMKVSPLDRDYLLMAVHFGTDAETRGLGKWYLDQVVPSMAKGDFAWRQGLYRDFIFASPDVEAVAPAKLPKSYRAEGTGWVNVRTGWGAEATSLSIAGSAVVDQSHAHLDTGSFTLFKRGWQALDAALMSSSGLAWQAGAHNLVTVEGHERRYGKAGGGLTRFAHEPGAYAYAQVDASDMFRTKAGGDQPMLAEYTRELVFLEPNTLVVFDRVAPKDGARYHLRLHTAREPKQKGRLFTAQNEGGALAYAIVIGGASRVRDDGDLADAPSKTFRIETAPEKGRFLTVLEVAAGAPPALAPVAVEGEGVAGLRVGDEVVVFSDAPRGEPRAPLRYRVEGAAKRHTIVNLSPDTGYDVDVTSASGATTVKVSPGGDARASREGVLRVEG